ncbi:hypothetical protein [Prochlorococcus marinus]|uniref:Protein family PM-3 n=1 Tax=Prochlorococcus marinus (strain MIT 9211) TaxID=93059 RepID=A9B9N9_PROM4|nr:hypothetical protein [Prochlorococcus marinus]ABX08551.1 Hypothetical protein P9211_06201 [Prochlorococcus marinus str. MIT 9211]
MSQLTIKVSAKAEAMIATLQKEIFNRRRKKVTAQGVVETLVESGAKSQSDKRYAASWKNLIKDIEKAAKSAEVHGNKPANVSAEEWALIVAHRTRKGSATKKATPKKRAVKKAVVKKSAAKKTSPRKTVSKKTVAKKVAPSTTAKPRKAKRARRAAKPAAVSK